VYGLDLRKAELDFYMMRYAAVTGISLLITGMGLISLIKIEVPQYMRPTEEWFVWQVFSFYVCAAATTCSALFNVVITGFLVVNAQGMALRGGSNSLVICIEILGDHWLLVKTVLIAELALLACSASLIMWMKLDESDWAPSPAIIITGVIFGVMAMGYQRVTQLAHELHIPSRAIVQGDLSIQPQGHQGKIDLLGSEREDAPPPRVNSRRRYDMYRKEVLVYFKGALSASGFFGPFSHGKVHVLCRSARAVVLRPCRAALARRRPPPGSRSTAHRELPRCRCGWRRAAGL